MDVTWDDAKADENLQKHQMPDEIDFSRGVRDMHYYPDIRIPVWLDPDVRRAFPTETAVNDALRALMHERAVREIKP